jgi:hypothetical protein
MSVSPGWTGALLSAERDHEQPLRASDEMVAAGAQKRLHTSATSSWLDSDRRASPEHDRRPTQRCHPSDVSTRRHRRPLCCSNRRQVARRPPLPPQDQTNGPNCRESNARRPAARDELVNGKRPTCPPVADCETHGRLVLACGARGVPGWRRRASRRNDSRLRRIRCLTSIHVESAPAAKGQLSAAARDRSGSACAAGDTRRPERQRSTTLPRMATSGRDPVRWPGGPFLRD